MTFRIRAGTDDDLNFIRSTWLRSFADSALAKAVTPSYWVGHIRVRDALLERCPPIVASLESEPTSVCGWACFEPTIVHYVFVRERWQGLGLVAELLAPFIGQENIVYTHKTRALDRLRIPPTWIYNPYLALLEPKEVA